MSDEMKLIEALANALGFNVIKKKVGPVAGERGFMGQATIRDVYDYSMKPRNNDCEKCNGNGYYYYAKCLIDCEDCNEEDGPLAQMRAAGQQEMLEAIKKLKGSPDDNQT